MVRLPGLPIENNRTKTLSLVLICAPLVPDDAISARSVGRCTNALFGCEAGFAG
jgi:hypothetical protein